MKTIISHKNRRLTIVLVLMLLAGFLLAVSRLWPQADSVEIKSVQKPSLPSAGQTSAGEISSHQPVYLRLGRVVSLKSKEQLILQSDKLDGPGSEDLTVWLDSRTKVIEIRVPNFITKKIERDLQTQGQAIKRMEVDFSYIKVDQAVAVLAAIDLYNLKEFTASRVEYQKYFDPPLE